MKRIGRIAIAGVLVVCLIGCSAVNALNEADDILTLVTPLGGGLASVVAVADPALAPTINAALPTYNKTAAALETAFANWASAAASAQPGAFNQVVAAMQAFEQSSNQLVSALPIPSSAASYAEDIVAAITSFTTELASVIQQIQAGGGTVAALQKLIEDGKLTDQVVLFVSAGKVQLPPGHKRAKDVRSDLVKSLSAEVAGNAKALSARKALAAQLKGLKLK